MFQRKSVATIGGEDSLEEMAEKKSIPSQSGVLNIQAETSGPWSGVESRARAEGGETPVGEELFRAVIESLAEGVLITDLHGRILYANGPMTALTGYTRDELAGRISHEVFTPREQWPAMSRRLQEQISGQSDYYEVEMLRKDGRLHWLAIRATPYRNARGEVAGTVCATACIEKQKSLEFENEYLHDELRKNFGNIIGQSMPLRKVLSQISIVAPTEANVLILGESGTGKELVARAIHEMSARKDSPLVRVNCASIPKELFESEFFGHVRGAFTGAVKDRVGRFELADGGTLFLDEIGEIPIDLQSKLLRVLQEGQFERLGEDRTRTVSVRLITATNRDLLAEAKTGRFRLDLYYRVSVFPIELPPLRDRPEDIGPMVGHFMEQAARRLGVARPRLAVSQVKALQAYDWPGNVRELQNVVERAVILARDGRLQFDLPAAAPASTAIPGVFPPSHVPMEENPSLDELVAREREIILDALRRANGKIYGADGAAALLKIKPTTLSSKIKRLKIGREQERG